MANVILHTSMGKIVLEIDEVKTPNTAKNFLEYCRSGFYNETIFHRVIDGFMIQGGGLTTDMVTKKTKPPIDNEAKDGYPNKIGTISMARTSDPHSATAQFFINVGNNDFLNYRADNEEGWGYCAFGKVTDGMDVVTKISHVNTVNRSNHNDVPEVPVILEKVELVTEIETA